MVAMIHWPPFRPLEEESINSIDKTLFVLEKMGNPHLKLKNIIHVTGTNGKGSTTSYIANILLYNGYNVNLYTSPHIYSCNERIKINGKNIDDGNLFYAIEKIRLTCEELNIMLSAFEATTVAAFLIFSEIIADINVIEVGMGGRDDATNVFNASQLKAAVFTPIDSDHVKFLGSTPYENAIIKSYIAKPEAIIVSAIQRNEVADFLEKVAKGLRCPFFLENRNFNLKKSEFDTNIQFIAEFQEEFRQGDKFKNMPLKPLLYGRYQYHNALNALAVILCADFKISTSKTFKAINKTYLPARLERIKKDALKHLVTAKSELYLDGAHNSHGAEALKVFLAERVKATDLNCYIINGRTKGSDLHSFIRPFKDLIKMLIGVEVKMEPLAEAAENIVKAAEDQGIKSLKGSSIEDALQKINIENKGMPFIAVICGSFYLARDLKLII